jgi:hypothetical protein
MPMTMLGVRVRIPDCLHVQVYIHVHVHVHVLVRVHVHVSVTMQHVDAAWSHGHPA